MTHGPVSGQPLIVLFAVNGLRSDVLGQRVARFDPGQRAALGYDLAVDDQVDRARRTGDLDCRR